VQSFGLDIGPQSFCYLFIALSITRWSKSAHKFAVWVCQVATVIMETTQLVLSQLKNFVPYQSKIEWSLSVSKITRSPASAGIANRPLVFLGIFFNFRQQHSNMVRREPASLLITLRQSLCLWRQYTLYTGLGTKRFIAIVFVTFRCRNIAKKTQNSFKNFGQKTKRIVADPIPHYCIHDNLGSLLC